MSFFTYSQLASELPDMGSSLVIRELAKIEAKLISLGFVFTAPVITTHNYRPSRDYPQSIFDLSFISSVTGVSLVDSYSNGVSQTNEVDYHLVGHPHLSGYYCRLELAQSISDPCFVQITGKKGMYIDTNLETTEVNLLKAGVIDYLSRLNSFVSSGYTRIKSSKTGKSEIQFADGGADIVNSMSVLQDETFNSILSFYL